MKESIREFINEGIITYIEFVMEFVSNIFEKIFLR